ncbi:unnamed protein product [Linum tenue]|uniref:Uncharacterized protein n=1 Tax=Linum tenue TaxID=586396 RepID=A0AAV0HH03_9ROSI|nr:unnamed protein product [Linum tenue]
MALNLSAASLSQSQISSSASPSTSASSCGGHQFVFLKQKHKDPLTKQLLRLVPSSKAFVQAADNGESDPSSSSSSSESLVMSSSRTQLELLEQLTSASPSPNGKGYESDRATSTTIREQLVRLAGDRDGDDFTIKLVGKNLNKASPKFLTTSQKRNIKRQAYLNKVSTRNDSVFFATIGAFVLLPPLIILGIAVATGYVQLFP